MELADRLLDIERRIAHAERSAWQVTSSGVPVSEGAANIFTPVASAVGLGYGSDSVVHDTWSRPITSIGGVSQPQAPTPFTVGPTGKFLIALTGGAYLAQGPSLDELMVSIGFSYTGTTPTGGAITRAADTGRAIRVGVTASAGALAVVTEIGTNALGTSLFLEEQEPGSQINGVYIEARADGTPPAPEGKIKTASYIILNF